ncbi:MAG: GHKL domain-containing protein [Oscillospiraceae bacterium]|nr:GHKL domain-containing protein [Oscillospiraceae bacterium]
MLFSVVSKKYFNDINSLLEKQIHTQIGFYEEREKTYAEIRRFKHDYTNHINCIRSMLNAEKYTEVAEYLENITGMFPSEGLLFNTGNFISDAILSDKQNSIAGENITINFEGTIPTVINETDLCIILGNAIDNAIEASREFDGEKTILVYGGFSHSYFILTVTNPTVNASNDRDILPFTSKADKSEHGFGLLNIKSVVDKYNGCMRTENKDNLFTLSLTFNSIISEVVKS